MPAEHMPAGHDGPDPLMAVLTGEPLPEEARADPARLAAYRAAEADVTLLRDQLTLLGDTLADAAPFPPPPPAPEPAPRAAGPTRPAAHSGPGGPGRSRRRSRVRALSLGTLVTAIVVTGALGTGWLVTHSPGGNATADGASSKADADAGAAGQSAAAYLACARLVVEGTVTAVRPGPRAGQQRVTLHVTRSYKPAKAPADVTFTWEEFLDPRPVKGRHALVGIPRNADVPDTWVVDTQELVQERDWLGGGRPAATATACP
ncbi:hypothetical protein [Streptomyces sp. NPDC014006]|uniref:hypothetical protein n=1 Tax=Streptomyces sp. NPDC014006 TaxID=3364870 RepID=UPI0036F911AC